jgi:glycosyltransferase involved in cell wall biosynthesis
MKISYGITVCDEAIELNSLLNFLLLHIDDNDEVIVLRDISKTNYDVHHILMEYTLAFREKGISYGIMDTELNGDFATFKNNLISMASGDYLFQIDADELPNQFLIENIKPILKINTDIDCFYIPRVNKVIGLTSQHIQKWGWRVDEEERVNFPDPQMRLFKLNQGIKWKNKVHEILDGYKTITTLPYDTEDFCLNHIKSIQKQEKQNNFYETI